MDRIFVALKIAAALAIVAIYLNESFGRPPMIRLLLNNAIGVGEVWSPCVSLSLIHT